MFTIQGQPAYTRVFATFGRRTEKRCTPEIREGIYKHGSGFTVRAREFSPFYMPCQLETVLRNHPGLTDTKSLRKPLLMFNLFGELMFASLDQPDQDVEAALSRALPDMRFLDVPDVRDKISQIMVQDECRTWPKNVASGELSIYQVMQLLGLTRGFQPSTLTVRFTKREIIGELQYWRYSTNTIELPLCGNRPFLQYPFHKRDVAKIKLAGDVNLPESIFVLDPNLLRQV